MGWLTNSVPREQAWRRQVEGRDGLVESSVIWLANGGLRLETVQAQGKRLIRQIVEDTEIREDRIRRSYLVQFARPDYKPYPWRSSWLLKLSITVEPQLTGTAVTVRVSPRPAKLTAAFHLISRSDARNGRSISQLAARAADSVMTAVTEQFAVSQRVKPGWPQEGETSASVTIRVQNSD